MNALFGKNVAIVSEQPGTTTDPVTRSFEIPGLGPAAIVDTAGIDDEGELGTLRIKAAMERTKSADMVIMVSPGHLGPTDAEELLYSRLFGKDAKTAKAPTLLVLTHGRETLDETKRNWLENAGGFRVESPEAKGITELITAIGKIAPAAEPTPLEGLVSEGDLIILVTPIDLAAPKGRLILPQVETLRDALDRGCASLVVKERELFRFYQALREPPKLVITDSQAFHKVAADIPEDQPLTSFSILFARKKGELDRYNPGLAALDNMKPAPRILMLESCSHHRQADDIGTVKIPRLFRQMVRRDAEFIFSRRMPEKEELENLDLVIMCASCMLTRTKVMTRLDAFKDAGVPVLNYGLFLAWANGLFPRALEPLEQ
jgi:[FeFe] hydrogenase H-cluster maturation GTPase HydF